MANRSLVFTYPCCKSELQVIRAESVVGDCSVDGFIQQRFIAKQVFRDAQPDTKELDQLR